MYVTVPPNRYSFASSGAAPRSGTNRITAEPVPPAATVIPPASTSAPDMAPPVPFANATNRSRHSFPSSSKIDGSNLRSVSAVSSFPLYIVSVPSNASRVIATVWLSSIVTDAQTESDWMSKASFIALKLSFHISPALANPLFRA